MKNANMNDGNKNGPKQSSNGVCIVAGINYHANIPLQVPPMQLVQASLTSNLTPPRLEAWTVDTEPMARGQDLGLKCKVRTLTISQSEMQRFVDNRSHTSLMDELEELNGQQKTMIFDNLRDHEAELISISTLRSENLATVLGDINATCLIWITTSRNPSVEQSVQSLSVPLTLYIKTCVAPIQRLYLIPLTLN